MLRSRVAHLLVPLFVMVAIVAAGAGPFFGWP